MSRYSCGRSQDDAKSPLVVGDLAFVWSKRVGNHIAFSVDVLSFAITMIMLVHNPY